MQYANLLLRHLASGNKEIVKCILSNKWVPISLGIRVPLEYKKKYKGKKGDLFGIELGIKSGLIDEVF